MKIDTEKLKPKSRRKRENNTKKQPREILRQKCRSCNGSGWMATGHGHFGDCNGDAGEALKPCLRECPVCHGYGEIAAW